MKKFFILFLALAASVGTIFASVNIDGIRYDLNEGELTAEVTYNEYSGKVVIPSSVNYDSKTYSVTSIGDQAFNYDTGLTSITIPNSVTSIGWSAFRRCTGLTSITIPNSVTSIGYVAFAGCSGLTSIVVASGNTKYDSRDNCNAIIETSSNTLIAGCKNTIIPNSVTSIGDDAFSDCTGLTSVTIPNSVTSIGYAAFIGCTGLTSITIPNSITSIGNEVFRGCSGLTSVTIPNSVTSIGYQAFLGCTGLTSITIPNSVTSIKGSAFLNCTGLTSVTIPNSVTSIEKYAFAGCTGLTAIYVPCGEMERFKQLLSGYSNIIKYVPLPYSLSITQPENGTISYPVNICDEMKLTAQPNYGYHFTQWSDGITDNPRTIELTQDTAFTAEFAHNPVITYNYNSEMGNVFGPTTTTTGIAEENITFEAIPNNGYHFVQWSDGVKDNPRTIWLSQDTTFTAEFAVDRSGTCGDNLALTWEYDAEIKALTIKGEGDLCSNYTFGVEAPVEMEKLIISEGVTAIGNGAFANQRTLKHISIASSVKTVYEQAFYNCTGLEQIYSYRNKPAVAYSNTFDGIDKFECTLHVLDGSVDMYKAATGWRDFYYIETIDAETITEEVEEVVVTPTETTANIVWPQVENSDSYTLIIWADEAQTEKICTLIFDAEGHLTGIDFSKKASRSVYTQEEQVAGFSFTVTGLDAGTEYFFNIIAKDEHGDELKTETGSFTTKSSMPMAVDEIANDKMRNCENAKILRDGQLYILRDGVLYNAHGARVE